MKKILILFLFIPNLSTGSDHPEKYYQDIECYIAAGVTEYTLPDRTRVDCVTEYIAVEVDFAYKWAESIGQSRHYASILGLFPVIWLIMESDKDCKYLLRLMPIANEDRIRVKQIGSYAGKCL